MGRKAMPHDEKREQRVVLKFTKDEKDMLDQWLALRDERVLSHVVRPLILAAAQHDLSAANRASSSEPK